MQFFVGITERIKKEISRQFAETICYRVWVSIFGSRFAINFHSNFFQSTLSTYKKFDYFTEIALITSFKRKFYLKTALFNFFENTVRNFFCIFFCWNNFKNFIANFLDNHYSITVNILSTIALKFPVRTASTIFLNISSNIISKSLSGRPYTISSSPLYDFLWKIPV